jgi:hypothetical protein
MSVDLNELKKRSLRLIVERESLIEAMAAVPAAERLSSESLRARRGAVMIASGTLPSDGLCFEAATLPIVSGPALIRRDACAPGAAR